ncbi:Urease accessory protein UreF [Phaffia rhodozyma]|uniref:Urease accessory protein UreF n=1 Tax=Phaffia rhodozyma TaxID=264483 RepID=A0A0F7SJY0_PHARH|nr:Urease accessory protein UreF [Phaffia rhodozyma]
MLTIWQKAFRQPAYLPLDELADRGWKECAVRRLMDRLKKEIREGRMMGHLPVCWGVLCAVLGLTLERTLHLHLYLHTRSILSSSVRLNQTGPYHAQTILLYTIQPLIEAELALYRASPGMGGVRSSEGIPRTQEEAEKADEQESEAGPMNCWPLGEILQGRHDVMHSRMFNT